MLRDSAYPELQSASAIMPSPVLITPALIAELRYELSAFRYQVDMLQLHLDRFEALFGRKRTKTTGIMRARATGKRKLALIN